MLEQNLSTCQFPDVNRIILQILLETTRYSSDERKEIKLESVAMACHLEIIRLDAMLAHTSPRLSHLTVPSYCAESEIVRNHIYEVARELFSVSSFNFRLTTPTRRGPRANVWSAPGTSNHTARRRWR
jgi:hypothetical protein